MQFLKVNKHLMMSNHMLSEEIKWCCFTNELGLWCDSNDSFISWFQLDVAYSVWHVLWTQMRYLLSRYELSRFPRIHWAADSTTETTTHSCLKGNHLLVSFYFFVVISCANCHITQKQKWGLGLSSF